MIINSILGGGTNLPSNMKIAKGSDFTWSYANNLSSFYTNDGRAFYTSSYQSNVICDMYAVGYYGRRDDKTIFNNAGTAGGTSAICIRDDSFNGDAESFAEHIKDMTIIYRTA